MFLFGCYTGQRVSDWGVGPDNIKTAKDGFRYLKIQQKKTKKFVFIPINKAIGEILARYNGKLFGFNEQIVNRYIKEIAQLAGINDNTEVVKNIGGENTVIEAPRYKFVTSHTARRTAVTIMWNQGLSLGSIAEVTGHESIEIVQTYIRAKEEDRAKKIMQTQYFRTF